MTTSLATLENSSLDVAERVVKYFRASQMFGTQTESQMIVKILAGRELGLPEFVSMQAIDIIQGRPAIKPIFMLGRLRQSPRYGYECTKSTDKECEIVINFDGKEAGRYKYTIDDASKEGLLSKMPWQKTPRQMLYWRAASNAVRMFAPDVFLGMPVYTPEELGADVNEDGEVIKGTQVEYVPQSQKQISQNPPSGNLISADQRKELFDIAKKHKYSNDEVKRYLEFYQFNTSGEVTIDKFGLICDDLKNGSAREVLNSGLQPDGTFAEEAEIVA